MSLRPVAQSGSIGRPVALSGELFLILTWRDVAVQYKQTVVGILWAVLRPLLTMAAFTFVFSKVAKLPSEGVAPYPLMVFVAMLPWQMFSTAIAATANSLVTNSNLVSKVYFPRIVFQRLLWVWLW